MHFNWIKKQQQLLSTAQKKAPNSKINAKKEDDIKVKMGDLFFIFAQNYIKKKLLNCFSVLKKNLSEYVQQQQHHKKKKD